MQFVEGHFVDAYNPTIENTFSKSLDVDGENYSLEIVDTAGQDEWSIFHSQYSLGVCPLFRSALCMCNVLAGIHGYILVYNIASKTSFDTLKIINDKILNYTGSSLWPYILNVRFLT